MRIGELASGLRYMITNEQREIFRLLKDHDELARHQLDERHQRLAEEMTKLGLIKRIYNEEKETVSYKLFSRQT